MTFIVYSLIIRTAWQGKMFEFLQKNLTKPEIQSVEEMIDRNFSLYLWEEFGNQYNVTEFYKGGHVVLIDNADNYVDMIQTKLYDPLFKGGIQIQGRTQFWNVKYSQGKLLNRLLEKRIMLQMNGILCSSFFTFLIKRFNSCLLLV